MSEAVALESAPCPLGCADNDTTLLVGRDQILGLPGEFTVVRCGTCGLLRTNPRPTPESIGLYYPESYGPYQSTRINAGGGSPAQRSWRTRFTELCDFKAHAVPMLKTQGRMLEIGCASGSFLHRMAQKGWEVEGIEFSPTAGEAARGLGYQVHIGTVEGAPDPQEPFDLIVGWMVLEHLHDPVHALRKLLRWAKPGATLVVSVPNVDSLEFRVFQERFYSLDVPRHLYHFTPDTLRKMLDRGGWRLTKVHHQRSLADLIASTGYWLRDRKWASQVAQGLMTYPQRRGRMEYYLYPIANLLSRLGQTGRMTVWAERLDD